MAPLRSTRRLLRRLGDIGHHRRALLLEALLWLMAARLALIFVPFPKLARRLGTFVPPADARAMPARTGVAPEQAGLAEAVGWAVTCAARHAPFEAACLPRAMAARVMLGRRGVHSVLQFGAARGLTKPLDAHAWLDAAGVKVTGYPVARHLAEIACFV